MIKVTELINVQFDTISVYTDDCENNVYFYAIENNGKKNVFNNYGMLIDYYYEKGYFN